MKRTKNGFTLVELLVTIFVVGLIFSIAGVYVFNVIKNSKDTTKILTESSIKNSANTYVKEYSDEVSWGKEDDEENQYACVLVDLLVEKGYLDDNEVDNYKYVKVIKDSNDNIVLEEFADEVDCANVTVRVPIPSNNICTSLKSNEFVDQLLIDTEKANLKDYTYDEEEAVQKEPGSYPVSLTLKENRIWSDGTTEPKEVWCVVDKKMPLVELDSYESGKLGLETYKIAMTSNVNGKVKIKVSNDKYVSTNISEGFVNTTEDFEIFITTLSGRNADTYITITVIPFGEDAKRYYSTSVVHTVSVKENFDTLIPVDIPTTEVSCNSNLIYNGREQILAKRSEGYEYISNTDVAVNAGEHTITAKLNDGYKWNDNTVSNKKFVCSINKRTPSIELKQTNKVITDLVGSVYKDKTIDISSIRGYYKYDDEIIDIPGVISIDSTDYISSTVSKHDGYDELANSLYKAVLKGLKLGSKKAFVVKFVPLDQVNFNDASKEYLLTIENNPYTLTYNTSKNGGNACNPGTKKVVYKEAYGELCTPTKSGYEFIGWYTSPTNRDTSTKVTANTKLTTESDVTIYAHFKKTITITYKSYSGSNPVTSSDSRTIYNNTSSASIKVPSFSAYSDGCGTWDKIGWSKSTTPGMAIDYEINKSYDFSNSTTLYAMYEKESRFIYDYNGGVRIPSRYEYSYFNASGASDNLGPWYEIVNQDAKRSGHKFLGWYEGTTRKVKPGETKTLSFKCGQTYMISAWWG